MIPKEFSEAVFHTEHKVLDVTLQPFCLYHLLALETIESPFIETEKPRTLLDLERAVLICSIPLPSNQKEDIEYSYKISNIFSKETKSPVKNWKSIFWSKDKFASKINDEYQKFIYYINDFSPSPDVVVEESGSQGIGAHWILSCASNVIKYSGWSKEYVFSMPVGLLYHFSIYFAASEGANIRFTSEKEDGVLEWLQSQGIAYQA